MDTDGLSCMANIAIERANLFIAVAGVLNLVVRKKTCGSYSEAELRDLAQDTISALKEMKRRSKTNDGPTEVPNTMREESESMLE